MPLSTISLHALLLVTACLVMGCNRPDAPRMHDLGAPPGPPSGEVTIHTARLGSVPSGDVDSSGRPTRVACVSCHSQRPEAKLPASPTELTEFHGGLTLAHGELGCASCHDAEITYQLHLADGKRVPGVAALQLCAQCHGPQTRDYNNGSHGGMTGYWDLSRGSRLRNHCVDCHDPHVPAFQTGHPVLPPKDRFLSSPSKHPEAHSHD